MCYFIISVCVCGDYNDDPNRLFRKFTKEEMDRLHRHCSVLIPVGTDIVYASKCMQISVS